MEGLLVYLENHYVTFIVLTVIMLFALVGYFAKKKADKDQPYKLADENARAEQELENLAQRVQKGASLQDFMSHNVALNIEEPKANPNVQTVSSTPVTPVAPVQPTSEIVSQAVVGQNPTSTTQQEQTISESIDTLI